MEKVLDYGHKILYRSFSCSKLYEFEGFSKLTKMFVSVASDKIELNNFLYRFHCRVQWLKGLLDHLKFFSFKVYNRLSSLCFNIPFMFASVFLRCDFVVHNRLFLIFYDFFLFFFPHKIVDSC